MNELVRNTFATGLRFGKYGAIAGAAGGGLLVAGTLFLGGTPMLAMASAMLFGEAVGSAITVGGLVAGALVTGAAAVYTGIKGFIAGAAIGGVYGAVTADRNAPLRTAEEKPSPGKGRVSDYRTQYGVPTVAPSPRNPNTSPAPQWVRPEYPQPDTLRPTFQDMPNPSHDRPPEVHRESAYVPPPPEPPHHDGNGQSSFFSSQHASGRSDHGFGYTKEPRSSFQDRVDHSRPPHGHGHEL